MTALPPEPEPGPGPAGDVFRAAAFEQLRPGAAGGPPAFDDRAARRAFWAVAAVPLVAVAAAFFVHVDEQAPGPSQDQGGDTVRSERLLVILVRPLFGGDEP